MRCVVLSQPTSAKPASLEKTVSKGRRFLHSTVGTVRRSLPKRAAGPKHHDALHFSEVGAALAKMDTTHCVPSRKRAIRLTALTATRQIEVRRASWEQLDLRRRCG